MRQANLVLKIKFPFFSPPQTPAKALGEQSIGTVEGELELNAAYRQEEGAKVSEREELTERPFFFSHPPSYERDTCAIVLKPLTN